jgi:biotin synthase
MHDVARILERLESTAHASREELALLLGLPEMDVGALYAAADRMRATTVGDEVHLRALIEFSNHCRRNCLYCGLRRGRRDLSRYRMSPEEVADAARAAADLGFRTVVLQSGEDPAYSADTLGSIVRGIKSDCDMAVTLSIGERSQEDYRLLREAGVDRYLLRIETSWPKLYHELHPDSDWHKRLLCLDTLRGLGYQIGSGVIIGLPGQTVEMLAEDLLFLQGLELDMIGVGPFIPHPSTPLGRAPRGALELSLRFVACLRLLCPQALIPATTALGALHPEGRQMALRAGADVLMPNSTPLPYRPQYEVYPGKIHPGDDVSTSRQYIEDMVAELGRRVGLGYGHGRGVAGRTPVGAEGAAA